MSTTVTGKNQVTVPASLASRANMRPGTRLDWELAESGDTLIVHVLPDTATGATRLRGSGRKHRRHGGSAVQNLVKERAQEDAGRG
jgi:bifunctional DNA-binding transcriptional regulator/antitoxin component of YhaV-PrlF toxin-antitoxin module